VGERARLDGSGRFRHLILCIEAVAKHRPCHTARCQRLRRRLASSLGLVGNIDHRSLAVVKMREHKTSINPTFRHLLRHSARQAIHVRIKGGVRGKLWSMAYESKIIDHLGLVASMYDELGIGMDIDDHIPQDCDRRIISVGDAVKAIQSSWTNGGFERLGLCQSAALPGAKLFREQTD
jgi:hypothetical protein